MIIISLICYRNARIENVFSFLLFDDFVEKSLLRQTIEESNKYQQNSDITGTTTYESVTQEKSPTQGTTVDTTVDVEKPKTETIENAASTIEQAKFDRNSNAVSFHSILNTI